MYPLMAWEEGQFFSDGHIPKTHALAGWLVGACGDDLTVGRKGKRPDGPAGLDNSALLRCGDVTQVQGAPPTRGDKGFPIWGESHRSELDLGLKLDGGLLCPSGEVPQCQHAGVRIVGFHAAVWTGRGQGLAVR